MEVRKLSTPQELLESERVIETAFLHSWDEDQARKKAEEAGNEPQTEEAWGLFDDEGHMTTSFSTRRRELFFGGETIAAGELDMVGSLPEYRSGGGVRALMAEVLRSFAARGDAIATLIPFSCAFYRKFGFEIASRTLCQRVAMEQLEGFACPYRVTQLRSEEELASLRALADAFARKRNLAELLPDAAWTWRGNSDFGAPDWLHPERQRYTYILRDDQGQTHAYVRFAYFHEPDRPFVGELQVSDLVYDSPEAFLGVLGFLWRMRAKVHHLNFELVEVDLASFLPENDRVEQKVDSHVMMRLLDVAKMLRLMPQPEGRGSYTIGLADAFLPENSGTYLVRYADGHATAVERCDAAPDLEADEPTLCQLIAGRISLAEARFRAGTRVNAQEEVLAEAFARRHVWLT